MTASHAARADLASVSWIYDSQFYEIDIQSNDAVFS